MFRSEKNSLVLGIGRSNQSNSVDLLGSCFPIGEGLVATAAHVIGLSDENLVLILPRAENLNEFQDEYDEDVRCIGLSLYRIDTVRDIAVLKFEGSIGSTANIGKLSDYSVSDNVLIYGFPHMDTGRFIATVQKSSIGAKVLVHKSYSKVRHAVINIQSSRGQSGSPVYLEKKFRAIAMVVGPYIPQLDTPTYINNINPSELHQTTYAVDAYYISEIMR